MFSFDDVMRQADRFGIRLSDSDHRLAQTNPDAGMSLLNCQRDYRAAKTDDARALAHGTASQIRSLYSVPASGDAASTVQTGQSPADFTWDPAGDAGYQSYRAAYLRDGQRAAQDAVGSAAALTGGVPSSYAVTAGTEASLNYADKLADKEAELRNAAYGRYMDELSYRSQLEKEAYQKERDSADDAYRYAALSQSAASAMSKQEGKERLLQAFDNVEHAKYTIEDLIYLRDNGYAAIFRDAGHDIDRMISELRMGSIPEQMFAKNKVIPRFLPVSHYKRP